MQNNDVELHLICAAVERPIYGSDEVVFEALADNLRRMIFERKLFLREARQSKADDDAERHLRSLLTQDAPERETIDALNHAGWKESMRYFVCAVEPADKDLRAANASGICLSLESEIEGCCAFTYLPAVAAVIRADGVNIDTIHDILRTLSGKAALRFGICEAYPGFRFLNQRFSLAMTALNHAKEKNGVAWFSDAAEAYIAERAVSEYPADLISMRPVFDMARYDREHGTNYIETAERYVANRFNAVKTANDLFIHRSTFLYRLERIKTQFGVDLDGEEISLVHLLLSIRLSKAQSMEP
jgi:hypothetical protein